MLGKTFFLNLIRESPTSMLDPQISKTSWVIVAMGSHYDHSSYIRNLKGS